MRRIAAGLVLVLALAAPACRHNDDGATDLDIVLRTAGGEENSYRAKCEPPRGTVPNPGALCDALADKGETMLATPTNRTLLCSAGHGTMYLDLHGHFRGKNINTELSFCGGNGKGLLLWLRHLPFPPSGRASNAGAAARTRIEQALRSKLASQPMDGAEGHEAPGALASVNCEETVLSFRSNRIFQCTATYEGGLRRDLCAAVIEDKVETSRGREALNCLPD